MQVGNRSIPRKFCAAIVIIGGALLATSVRANPALEGYLNQESLAKQLVELDRSDLVKETKILKRKVFKTTEIVGDSAPIRNIKSMIDKVAPTEARVLITGGNGSGKELVARALHEASERDKREPVTHERQVLCDKEQS